MKKISLSRGLFATIDADDFERVSMFKWSAQLSPGSPAYAVRKPTKNGKRITVWLHRFIVRCPQSKFVDHINGDGLDNRKCNLRVISGARQNNGNRNVYQKNAAGVRGIRRMHKKWAARISINGRAICLGSYPTKQEAFEVYKQAHIQRHGKFSFYARESLVS